LIITGKKTMTATIIILDSGLSIPNQLLSIGAKAIIGTELAAMATGIKLSLAVVQRAVAKATPTPNVLPMKNPPSASFVVNQPTWMSKSKSSVNVPAILLGAGSKKF
jgi:hypothetical protein